MTKLLLVRHGETEWNQPGIFQGHRDTPLTELGRNQVASLRDRFRGEDIRAAYCSDLGRAIQTSNILLEPHHLAANPCPELRERSYGKWEGLSMEQVIAQEPELAKEYSKRNPDFAPPEGESVRDVLKRARGFLTPLAAQLDAHSNSSGVLVVGHLGSLRAILMGFLGIKASYFWRLRIDLASLTLLETTSRGIVLTLFNDTSHQRRSPSAS